MGWGGYSATLDLDLGEKVGNSNFSEGGYSATSDLDLGKKLEIRIFGMGGYSATSDLDLGEKVGNSNFSEGGGVICNFGFGLRGKSWKFEFFGGGVIWKGNEKKQKTTYFTAKLTRSIWNNSQVPHSQWTSQSVLSANWTLEQPSQKAAQNSKSNKCWKWTCC